MKSEMKKWRDEKNFLVQTYVKQNLVWILLNGQKIVVDSKLQTQLST